MFDFGFWEIAIIGIITLIVVGPTRMPGLARKAGLYFGKFNNFINKIKKDINDELKADELRETFTHKESKIDKSKIDKSKIDKSKTLDDD